MTEDEQGMLDAELLAAARLGDRTAVERLLAAGARVDAWVPHEGDRPLHLAAAGGHADVVKFLLDGGADMHAGNVENYTPLHVAAAEGCADVVKLLLEKGAHVNSRGSRGETPLHHAAACGKMEVVSLLLEKDAGLHDVDKMGNTPLHVAAFGGHNELVEFLLCRAADADRKNYGGEKPFDLADGYPETRETLAEWERAGGFAGKWQAEVSAIAARQRQLGSLRRRGPSI